MNYQNVETDDRYISVGPYIGPREKMTIDGLINLAPHNDRADCDLFGLKRVMFKCSSTGSQFGTARIDMLFRSKTSPNKLADIHVVAELHPIWEAFDYDVFARKAHAQEPGGQHIKNIVLVATLKK